MTEKISRIEIEGEFWLTKKALMSELNIKKSLFYNLVNSGDIISRQPFDGAAFRVYKLNPEKND